MKTMQSRAKKPPRTLAEALLQISRKVAKVKRDGPTCATWSWRDAIAAEMLMEKFFALSVENDVDQTAKACEELEGPERRRCLDICEGVMKFSEEYDCPEGVGAVNTVRLLIQDGEEFDKDSWELSKALTAQDFPPDRKPS